MAKKSSLAGKAPRLTSRPKPPKADGREDGGTRTDFPIVAIGGSAGGLESASNLLRALPASPGVAIVMLQHLSPDQPSRLAEYFQRVTELPVAEIAHGTKLERNRVYVLPAGSFIEIVERTLRLVERRTNDHVALPIDHFFSSLAVEEGPRAIAVILSGRNADGALGISAIKNEGGVTFAESDRTARYTDMPHHAVETGCVDSVLTPEEIASNIAELGRLRCPPLELSVDGERRGAQVEQQPPATPPELRKIFQLVRQQTGVDFTLYKRSTVQRRITRRLLLHRFETLERYVELLRESPDEGQALFSDLLINVTSFFRDKPVFQSLSRKILPHILETRKKHGGDIRIWVPGCATGQEVYSLAILVMEALRKRGSQQGVQIFGTDLSESAISIARAGIFPAAALKDVSPERLRRFFQKVDGNFQVSRAIRDICTFARQNVCSDPPFSRLDLISCRNVLIYLGAELQRRCFPIFHYALQPDGFLLLGSAETVGQAPTLFTLVDKRNKIYTKKVTPLRPEVEFGKSNIIVKTGVAKPVQPHRQEADLATEIRAEADRLVLTQAAPSGVVVDSDLQVLQFRGQTSPFLEHHPGEASLNLLQMVRPSLSMDLRTLTHKALKQNIVARGQDLVSEKQGKTQLLDVEVLPFRVPTGGDQRWLLVLFFPKHEITGARMVDGETPQTRSATGAQQKEMQRVRDELRATKESLQAIIEEQEATNEELKSANEEIESSNEELQSSNEELETAKEELQSTNEELQTLNEELNTRNAETALVNDDLKNLLASINLPIVMVDGDLTIRRATPLAEKLFNIIPSDIGRRLTDIKPNLDMPDLELHIQQVIDSLQTQELEARDKEDRVYSVRIRPYRTRDHKIDGAVITIVDVDAILKTRPNRERLRQAVETLAVTLRELVLLLQPDLHICAANQSFRETYHLRERDVVGQSVFEIDDRRWDVPDLRQLLEKAAPGRRRVQEVSIGPRPGDKLRGKTVVTGCNLPIGTDSILLLTFTLVPEEISEASGKTS